MPKDEGSQAVFTEVPSLEAVKEHHVHVLS